MTQLTDMTDAVDSAHQRKTLRRGSRAMTTAAGSHAVEARQGQRPAAPPRGTSSSVGSAGGLGEPVRGDRLAPARRM